MRILSVALLAVMSCDAALAGCHLPQQGDGRVAVIIDARTFRLNDGREIRLAGIQTDIAGRTTPTHALAVLIEGRDVSLEAGDDGPDRYGRQTAIVFPAGSETSVQTDLLSQGEALASMTLHDKACSGEWTIAESEARVAGRGLWGDPAVTKNPEMPGDILASIGQFVVVEGKVLSARQAGATFYINFGRRWTRDFAVTISRRMMPAFETAGLDFKSIEGKTVRVRGWVEKHGGPRIEAAHVGQIELTDAGNGMAKSIVPADKGK